MTASLSPGLCRLQDEVVHRVFVSAGPLGLLVDVGAESHERRGIDFHLEIEMRNLRFGSEEAFRDDIAHAGERDALIIGTGEKRRRVVMPIRLTRS